MARLSSLASPIALAATLLAAAPGAAQQPFASMDLLWVHPAASAGAPAPCARLLVLDLPRDWASGDAAAILLTTTRADARPAARIAAALIAQDTAVLHLDSGAGGGIGPCAEAPHDPVGEVLGALAALKHQAGAGLVVAIGLGASGPAVLAAAREAVTEALLGPGGPRLAAGIALDGTRPARFQPGAPPPAAEAWSHRAPLLCEALAAGSNPALLPACRAALLPGAHGHASLRPPRP